jgi:hypothetical protein
LLCQRQPNFQLAALIERGLEKQNKYHLQRFNSLTKNSIYRRRSAPRERICRRTSGTLFPFSAVAVLFLVSLL